MCIVVYSSIYLKRHYSTKLRVHYEFKKGDIKWTIPKILIMSLIAFVAGILSSALGLGGGVVYNPLLLELGIPPTVSSATGMYLVMFGTFTNTILFALADLVYWGWGFW
jgi:uncharacterized membrane protein YfcA